jgi:hypothetical protein
MKKIQTKYAIKMVDNKYYSAIEIEEISSDKPHTEKEVIEPGYILAPYTFFNTKITVSDKNGTRSYWQISRWMRFKLFLYGLFHRKRKI